MNISVASTHWSQFRTEIGSSHIDERFPESRTPGLVADQRRENVAFALIQKHSAGRTHRFLPAAKVNTARNHAAAIQAGQFLLKDARQEHPAKPFEITLVGQFLGSGSAAFGGLK